MNSKPKPCPKSHLRPHFPARSHILQHITKSNLKQNADCKTIWRSFTISSTSIPEMKWGKYQSAYKAEVYGMFLACKYSSSCATIFTDCYAVLKAVKYRKQRLVEARLIRFIREHVDRKHLSLQYVRGHSGIPGNEEVDRRAKAAVNLPDAPVQIPVEVGDVSYHGELFTYPHKVWTRYETPTHRHKGVWSGCWKQLKFGFTIWIRWFFGGIISPGYSFPLTYWHPEHTGAIDPQRCWLCKTYHNESVHG